MNTNKEKEYLSYSRAYVFLNNRWEFIRTYILKEKKEKKDSKFHRMHKIIENFFVNPSSLEEKKKKYSTKQLNDFYLASQNKYLLNESETEFLDNFKLFINLDYNTDLKKCMNNKIFNKWLKDDNLKIRAELDSLDGTMILDFKGETIKTLHQKKLKYGLQQVIYSHLFKYNFDVNFILFYFISLPLTYPYNFSRFTFPKMWIEGIEKLFFNKILPEYQEYVFKLKQIFGDDIFFRDVSKSKSEILNKLVKHKLLSVDFEISPSPYEYKDLDLMITEDYSNRSKIDFYSKEM